MVVASRSLRALPVVLALAAGLHCSDSSAIGPGRVVEVRIVPDSLTLDPGQQVAVRAFPVDADSAFLARKQANWASNDGGIASVDDTGLVTAVGLGNTQVTATVDGVTGTIAVAVVPPAPAFAVDTAAFVSAQGGANPASQTITVRTARATQLTGLAVGGITYTAGPGGWLQASLDVTTTPANLLLSATTSGLSSSTFRAQVQVTSDNGDPGILEVEFVVGAGPTILLQPGNLDLFAVPSGNDPAPAMVQVQNAGGGTLTGLVVGTIGYGPGASDWITSATLDQSTAPATLTVQASVASLAGGVYTATVPVTSAGAVNSPEVLDVTFTVTNQATIQLSTGSASLAAAHLGSNPAPATVDVTNGSGGTLGGLALSVGYGPGATGWLNATLDQTTAPATLTLQPGTGALAVGTYSATVTITSPVAVNSPQTVTVTFRIQTSFVNDVQPVLTNGCIGCHNGGVAFPLPNPWPYNQLVNAPGCSNGTNADSLLIVPGSLATSYLFQLMDGTTTCNFSGFTVMPPGGPLPQAQRTIMRLWILDGAPNN